MNPYAERISSRAKEYICKNMQDLRIVSRSFLKTCDGNGKDGARAQILRLRRIIERMDSYGFKPRDRRFVLQAKELLLPTFEQAFKSFNQGNWFLTRQSINDAIVDTMTIEKVTSGYHESEMFGTRSI
jgi:hypothetical protein